MRSMSLASHTKFFLQEVATKKTKSGFWGLGLSSMGLWENLIRVVSDLGFSRLGGLVTRIGPIRYREFLRGIHTRLNPTEQLGGCMISIPGGEDTST